jgi:very-short-patch-repair endonuclease
MKVKDILLSMPTKEIYKSVRKQYKEGSRKQYKEYMKCIEILKSLSEQEYYGDYFKDYELVVEFDGEYHNVFPGNKHHREDILDGYSLTGTPFIDFVNLDISDDTFERYSTRKIIGHAVWEITWYGFDDGDGERFLRGLYKNIAETNKKLDNPLF